MEGFTMRNLNTTKLTVKFISVFALLILATFQMNAQNYITSKNTSDYVTLDLIMKNIEKSLDSENHGVVMSTVENIGKYKLSNFEDNLIEMLGETEDTNDKKIIALSLAQLGSLNCINTIKNSVIENSDTEYTDFCEELLSSLYAYDKLRSKYFEAFVDNIIETK
jgi:hypothetical protein